MTIIASFAVMLTFLSGRVGENAAIGEKAPEVVGQRVFATADTAPVSDTLTVAPLEEARARGRKVILSFWSAADAQSRLMQKSVKDAVAGRAGIDNDDNNSGDQVEVVSVNFDRSERLMKEIVRLDGLLASSQLRVAPGDAALALREAYRMEQQLRTFLIDSQGRIVAADPSEEELRRFVG